MSYRKLVETCEEVWEGIQENCLDVPDAFVVVGSGGRRAKTLNGHFARDVWELDGNPIHEVLLVAERLQRPAEEVFTTILHEAVHGIAAVRDIKDCSGKRHNKKFAELCHEVDLIPPEKPDKVLGFSAATLSLCAKTLYQEEIKKLEEALSFYRKLNLVAAEKKKTLWKAECDCGRSLRLGKGFINEMPDNLKLSCGWCENDFELVEEY